MPPKNGLCEDISRKLRPALYGKEPIWDRHFEGHAAAEMAKVREAVKFHALRPPRPGVPCEACYTVIITGACSICVHLHAAIPPLGLVEDDRPGTDGTLEAEVPAGIWQLIEQAAAAVPEYQSAALPQSASLVVNIAPEA